MTNLAWRVATTGLAIAIALGGAPAAAERTAPVEHFVGRAASGRIDIVIERWSSDADRERLRTAMAGRQTDLLLGALRMLKRRAGYVMFPGVQGLGARARTRRGQNVQYAREIVTKRVRQVILVTDQRPGFERTTRATPAPPREFTVIDIRLDRDGGGIGRVGTATGVVWNKQTDTIELQRYTAQPVALEEVKSEND